MSVMAAAGSGQRRVETDVQRRIDLVIAEIGVVALSVSAQLEPALMGVILETGLKTDPLRKFLAHDQPAAQGPIARQAVVAGEVIGELTRIVGDAYSIEICIKFLLERLPGDEGVDSSYVSRMVNLTTLAPVIVAAILEETLPPKGDAFRAGGRPASAVGGAEAADWNADRYRGL